jgi:3D (Asp-Asp-Asp) domain-containing protein
MKAIVGRSAIIASALLLGLVSFSAETSIAETLLSPFQTQRQDQNSDIIVDKSVSEAVETLDAAPSKLNGTVEKPKAYLVSAVHYVATAYSLRGKTASGRMVSKGLIAADPRVLPLGSRVQLEAGGYSGEYLVADTGGMIRGRRIDIWIPSSREAMRFGRRTVKLTVLSYPPKRMKRTAKG